MHTAQMHTQMDKLTSTLLLLFNYYIPSIEVQLMPTAMHVILIQLSSLTHVHPIDSCSHYLATIKG